MTPHTAPSGGRDGPPEDESPDSSDIVYGASFVTMTAPDLRASYLEGTFMPSAFYPRQGCKDPAGWFKILGASGFSAANALTASAIGTLPTESDPNACTESMPDATVVPVPARAPSEVVEVACAERTTDGSVRYRQPPTGPTPARTFRPSAATASPI